MAKKLYEEADIQDIADAIREKNGETTTYKAREMGAAVRAITTGSGEGGISEEMRTFTGDIAYLFADGRFIDWQDEYPFILKDITRMTNLFNYCPEDKDLSKITITTLDYPDVNNGAYITGIFNYSKSNNLPKINGRIAIFNSSMFQNCINLQDETIRQFFANPNLELSWCHVNTRPSNPGIYSMFNNCKQIRNVSDILLYIHQYFRDNPISHTSSLTDYYSNSFSSCVALDEVQNIPIFEFPIHNGNTSNIFNNTFYTCHRLKEITFVTDNGTPYTKKWKNQMIDISYQVGYTPYPGNVFGYGGITADKEVKDDATYQTLKNDPDWFTTKEEYSRYNHDSAVNTINSLPDTSAYLATAGGTNTIKFKSNAGSATDGGAINTLTEEEIAVAAAKGWTVTLV